MEKVSLSFLKDPVVRKLKAASTIAANGFSQVCLGQAVNNQTFIETVLLARLSK